MYLIDWWEKRSGANSMCSKAAALVAHDFNLMFACAVTTTCVLWRIRCLFRIFTMFSKALCFDTACRVWDLFCRDGEEFLFKTAIGKSASDVQSCSLLRWFATLLIRRRKSKNVNSTPTPNALFTVSDRNNLTTCTCWTEGHRQRPFLILPCFHFRVVTDRVMTEQCCHQNKIFSLRLYRQLEVQ